MSGCLWVVVVGVYMKEVGDEPVKGEIVQSCRKIKIKN